MAYDAAAADRGTATEELSWEKLHLSDVLDEPETLHSELRALFLTQLTVCPPVHGCLLLPVDICHQALSKQFSGAMTAIKSYITAVFATDSDRAVFLKIVYRS